MTASNLLTETLSKLSVPRGRVLYIHSSMDWLIRAGIGVGEALDSLIEWTSIRRRHPGLPRISVSGLARGILAKQSPPSMCGAAPPAWDC